MDRTAHFDVPDVWEFGCDDSERARRVAVRAFAPPSYRSYDLENEEVRRLERYVRDTVRDVNTFFRRRARGGGAKDDTDMAPGDSSSASYINRMLLNNRDAGARKALECVREISADMIERYRGCATSADGVHSPNTVTLHDAHREFLECRALLRACGELHCGDDSDAKRLQALVMQYWRTRGAPFAWTSSASLHSDVMSPVYFTYVPREHCIMLAWRCAMLALHHAMRVFDPCQDFRSFYEYADGEYKARRQLAVSLVSYAIVILENFVLGMVCEGVGTPRLQALTRAAAALPEMRVENIGAMAKTARATLTCIVVNHFNYNAILRDADLTHEAIRQNTDRCDSVDDMRAEEKELCYNLINATFLDEDARTINSCMSMRSAAFHMCFEALEQFTRAAWRDSLINMFPWLEDCDDEEVTRGVFASPAHRAAHVWMQHNVERRAPGPNRRPPKHINRHACASYRRADAARCLRHFLAGTAVYQEVFLNAHALAECDVDDTDAIMRASVLAQKCEIMLCPLYGRRRASFEFVAWLLSDVRLRAEFCSEIADVVEYDTRAYEKGKSSSLLTTYCYPRMLESMKRKIGKRLFGDDAEEDAVAGTYGIGDAYDDAVGRRDYFSLRQLSQSAARLFRAQKDDDGDDADAHAEPREIVPLGDYDGIVETRSVAKHRRIVPFDGDDVELWYSVHGAYESAKECEDDAPRHLQGAAHRFTEVRPKCLLPETVYTHLANAHSDITRDVAARVQAALSSRTK